MQVRALGEALAAGPAAALAGSAAASILAGAARAADGGAHAAQAAALGERLTRAAGTDAEALAAARADLAAPAGDARSDFALGRSLERAAAVPLLIAEACADLVALAQALEPIVAADEVPDVQAAAMLAAGAAHAAAHLVQVNLGVGPDDARLARARAAVAAADLALDG